MSVAEDYAPEVEASDETEAKGTLPLPSFRVQNYRGFKDLTIPSLTRVNLIVGKNGVGKSALLEAIWLYLTKGDRDAVLTILERGGDYRRRSATQVPRSHDLGARSYYAVQNLFWGRPPFGQVWPTIILSRGEGECPLMADFSWVRPLDPTWSLSRDLRKDRPHKEDAPVLTFWAPPAPISAGAGSESRLHYHTFDVSSDDLSGHEGRDDTIPPFEGLREIDAEDLRPLDCFFLIECDVSQADVLRLWDDIVLSSDEKEVIAATHVIDPSVERIAAVETVAGRQFIVKARGRDDPFPLRNLGEGMNRVFRLAVALAWCRDGALFLDEVENGIHWRVQPALWQTIFRLAEQFNVQIFATTHSSDCLRGFGEAAQDTPDEGQLIRIEQRGDKSDVVLVPGDDVAIAAEEHIELR